MLLSVFAVDHTIPYSQITQTRQIYLRLLFFWATVVRQSNLSSQVLEEAQWRHCCIRGNATKLNGFLFILLECEWSTVFSLLRERYWCHQCIKKCNIYVAGLCVTVGTRQASHCFILDFLYFEINRSLPLSAAPLWLQASLGQSPNAHL